MCTLFNNKIKIINIILLISILINGNFGENENYLFEYNHPRNCKSNEYFNISSFSCIECDHRKNLVPSENGLTCVCNKYSRNIGYQNDSLKCEKCKPGTVLTSDRKNCIQCEDGDNLTCSCAINEIKVERNINAELLTTLRCVQCSNNSYPSLDGLKCIPCQNDTESVHGNCACPIESHIRIEDYCFSKNKIDFMDIRNTYLVQFKNENVDSFYLRNKLKLSAYLCKDGNETECEHLSNMCALTLSEKSIPCKLSKFKQYPQGVLWMFYEKDGYPVITNNKLIPIKYTLNKIELNNYLNFSMATFSLNGNLKYLDMPNLFCTILNNVRFGININKQCHIHAKELINKEINFFVPYFLYNDKGKLFSNILPLFVKNKVWEPLKKFFLIDNVSSFRAVHNLIDGTFRQENELHVLRYMKSIEILIIVQNDRKGSHIYLPLIIVEYDELKKQDIQDNKKIAVDYKVTFILMNKSTNNTMEIATGILSGFALIHTVLRACSYCKRNYNGIFNIRVIIWFFIFCLGTVGNVLLLVTITICVYTFIFYKGQTVLHILLPTHNIESKIFVCIIIAFCFKVVEILALIYRHRNIKIFFMDWEQPRTIRMSTRYDSPHTSLKKLYERRFEQNKGTGTQRYLESDTEDDTIKNLQHLPVSIWRTYFVANQWLKIQTKRRINITLQIIFTLFLLEIVGLKYWSWATPELQVDENEKYLLNKKNFTLRLGVGALVYIFCYSIQWIISITFYERYIKNRMQDFVDLCSVANISIFIFAYDYYGYYIHGRSVHGYADTDLETLINDLKKEESNVCAHRGLIPGTTNQTFITSLSSSFKEIYHKLLDLENSNNGTFLRRNLLGSFNWEKCLQSHLKIKKFLAAFIDHCFKELDYIIKERLFIEKLCDIEIGTNNDKSIFYTDDDNTFDRVIFYGNEWTLGTFEIALFIFVQMMFENYIIACIVTMIISQMIITITRINGKTNLARKTLIDERFLM